MRKYLANEIKAKLTHLRFNYAGSIVVHANRITSCKNDNNNRNMLLLESKPIVLAARRRVRVFCELEFVPAE
jgi:hypothetical protein